MLAHKRLGVEVVFEDHPLPIGKKPHLRVSQEAYDALCDELIIAIADSGWMPNQLVGIMCGGGPPARAMKLALGVNLAFHGAESYEPEVHGDQRNMMAASGIQFARDLMKTHPGFGTSVLVIDDLTDSGRTFEQTVEWLRRSPKYGGGIKEIRTACLWYKKCSTFCPNYFVDTVVGLETPGVEGLVMPWIDQPAETKYAVSIETIRERVRARHA